MSEYSSSDIQAKIQAEIAAEKVALGLDKEETKAVTEDVVDTTEEVKSTVGDLKTTAESTLDETEAVTEENNYTDVEKEAIANGWNPNYKGPNKKTAEQFNKDGSFFKKIDEQKSEINELKNLVKQQIEHNKKVERAAYEKALKDLQAARVKAVHEGDVDTFNSVEQQARIVHEQLAQVAPAPQQEVASSELKEFINRNSAWFNLETAENRRMAKVADFVFKLIGDDAKENGRTISEAEQLKMVEAEIRKQFPARFENLNQKKPSMVAKSTTSTSAGTKTLADSLTDRQRDFIKRAKRIDPSFKTEDYIKQLKMTGDLTNE